MSNFFSSLDIAASGMTAQKFQMDIISSNIANANTVNQVSGEPYRRKFAMFESQQTEHFALPVGLNDDDDSDMMGISVGKGVKMAGAMEDTSENAFKYIYDPSNPVAEKDGKWKGYIKKPNINIIQEMTSLIEASRAYEANAQLVQAAKQMAQKGASIGN
jgi:flagellar basal-body rod protein FlgC